jgi:uncharacterized protein
LRARGERVLVTVRVIPGASRSEITGVSDGCLRVRVAAPAREDRANRELCRTLAGRLGLPPSSVTIARGASSRRKLVELSGVTPAEASDRLGLQKGM